MTSDKNLLSCASCHQSYRIDDVTFADLQSLLLMTFADLQSLLLTHDCYTYAGAELGGCQEGPLPPQNFPRDVMPLHWSPTQTIDSSPCCKTGPSSGPPNENVWLRPCTYGTCQIETGFGF